MTHRRFLVCLLAILAGVPSAHAQDPPPPVAPDVTAPDAVQQARARATKLGQPLRVDGRLDEDIYEAVKPITDFIQTLPKNGEGPTERTEAWILYDSEYVYLSGRCWDSAPPS